MKIEIAELRSAASNLFKSPTDQYESSKERLEAAAVKFLCASGYVVQKLRDQEQSAEIAKAYLNGKTQKAVGSEFGLSQARVGQIVHRFCKSVNPVAYMQGNSFCDLRRRKSKFIG